MGITAPVTVVKPKLVCNATSSYYIGITDAGCSATSNQVTEAIEDTKDPDVPVIDSVSVDTATGAVMIAWAPSIARETGGYIVYNFGSNPTPITHNDTVNTFLVDPNVTANNQTEGFGVAAFDTCDVPGPPNTSPTNVLHNTVHLVVTPDACERTMLLDWSPYEGWANGAAEYRVYGRHQDSTWALLALVNGSETEWLHEDLDVNVNYFYFIRAVEAGGDATSSSNQVVLPLVIPNLPQWHYLKLVTVDGGHPELQCYVDTLAQISHYSIQRSSVEGGEYVEIDTLQRLTPGEEVFEFRDGKVDADSISWFYRVVVIDVCGNEVVWSNEANTMVVGANINQETLNVDLEWGDYNGWDEFATGPSAIAIYRYQNGVFDDTPIVTLPPDATEYTDNVTNEYESTGQLCYLVQAIEDVNNPYGYQDTSNSNVICVFAKPRIYVPNAFTPNDDGLNDVWYPGLFFTDKSDYQLLIFDRWGQNVFSSTNPQEGWDGRANGSVPHTDVYMYRITYGNGQGEILTKTGRVTLLK